MPCCLYQDLFDGCLYDYVLIVAVMAPKAKQPRQVLKDQLLDPDLKEGKDNKINLGYTGSLKRALDDLAVDVRTGL